MENALQSLTNTLEAINSRQAAAVGAPGRASTLRHSPRPCSIASVSTSTPTSATPTRTPRQTSSGIRPYPNQPPPLAQAPAPRRTIAPPTPLAARVQLISAMIPPTPTCSSRPVFLNPGRWLLQRRCATTMPAPPSRARIRPTTIRVCCSWLHSASTKLVAKARARASTSRASSRHTPISPSPSNRTSSRFVRARPSCVPMQREDPVLSLRVPAQLTTRRTRTMRHLRSMRPTCFCRKCRRASARRNSRSSRSTR